MKKLFTLATVMLMVMTSIFAQDNVTKVTFTGERQDKSYQKLDSVLVTNLTQNWSEVVYYPDTLILLSNVGITDYESRDGQVHLYQNIPNPFHGVTNFNLSLGNKEKVDMVIYDISGRKVAEYHNTLPSGEHQFRAAMDIPQTYLLSAVTKSGTTSIKMINLSNTGEKANIELISSLPLASDYVKKESIHGFKVGDEMQYVAYATQKDGVKDVTVKKAQTESETITFVFPNEASDVTDPEINVTTGNATITELTTVTLAGTYEVKNTEVKETGFEYKVSTAADFTKVTCKGTTSPFTATLNDIELGVEYTYKAYVMTKEDSVVYGDVKTFKSDKVKEPVVKTDDPSDISQRSATFHGSFEAGSEKLSMIGFELKKAEGGMFDAISNSEVIESPFQYTYTDKLEPNTKYICRAYVFTETGNSYYGNEVSFETPKADEEMPVVRIEDVNVAYYKEIKALLYAEVVSNGNSNITEGGFYVGTTENLLEEGEKYLATNHFDITNSHFKCETKLLQPETTYYCMAYVTNGVGTAYSDIVTFKSRKAGAAPEVSIVDLSSTSTSAQVSCSLKHAVLGPGETEESIEEKGVCYSEKENPTVADTKVVADNNKFADYVIKLSDLKENTTYYVRAYAEVFGKTVYSNQEKVVTSVVVKPGVQTISVGKVGGANATVTSKLTERGGAENIVLGVRVFNEELKYDSIFVTNGTLNTDNTFDTKVSNLQKETKYSVQAYARNSAGEAFGETLEFTTTAGFSCGEMLSDIEDNQYKTVQIGSQCWMQEDLRTKTMPDGSKINEFKEGSAVPDNMGLTPSKPYYYEREDENIGHHLYYPWSTATKMSSNTDNNLVVQGICPDGWHVPSWWEVRDLLMLVDPDFKADDAYNYNTELPSNNKLGIKLSAPQSESYWYYHAGPGYGEINKTYNTIPNTPAYNYPDNTDPDFNASRFRAVPNGYISRKDGMFWFNASLNMWTSINDNSKAGALKVAMNQTGVIYCTYSNLCNDFYAVRCIMD